MAISPPKDVLTPEQRDQVDKFLKSPISYPSEFKSWLTDYLSVNIPYIPVSQLLGYKGTLSNNQVVNDAEAVNGGYAAERTWVDLPSYGPSVTGLADGTYFVMFGALLGRGSAGGAWCSVGVSINGADPSTPFIRSLYNDPDAMNMFAHPYTVANNDNNEIRLMYMYDLGGGATAEFSNRWMTVVRIT